MVFTEVMFVLTFGAPVLFLLLCLYVYAALIRKQAYPALRLATRVMVRLRQAMMVDVFFVSTLVAYIKLVCGKGSLQASVLSDVRAVGYADSDFGIGYSIGCISKSGG